MITYGRQSINEIDVHGVIQALKSEFLTTGPLVKQFEDELEKYIGAKTCVVSSGTAALHCAFKAINIKNGDEIITTPNTFVATQATAISLGAVPVFADIEETTGNIDVNNIERLITRKTKAIVSVDYAGHPCDISEISRIAKKHNIFFIEDAAHSLGSMYNKRVIGSQADITTFSFYPTKNITTSEGGAISTNNALLMERARLFSRQGLIRDPDRFELENDGPWHQEVHEFGLNYRLPDILCALGISQLKRIEEFKRRRWEIWHKYQEGLSNIPQIKIPIFKENVNPMWHLYPIRVSAKMRKEIFIGLRKLGIFVQVNYVPSYWHPAFRNMGYKKGLCPISEEFYSQEISLPIHCELNDEDIDYIISSLRNLVNYRTETS